MPRNQSRNSALRSIGTTTFCTARSRPKSADPTALHAERLRAPVPVRVPPPQVVVDREPVGIEHHIAELVHALIVQSAGHGDMVHRSDQFGERVESQMPHCDERFNRLQSDGEADRVAQSVVRVGKGSIEFLVLGRRGGRDLFRAGMDVYVRHRLERQVVNSMPRPRTAPPSVIVFSYVTADCTNPRGSVAATRSPRCTCHRHGWPSAKSSDGS